MAKTQQAIMKAVEVDTTIGLDMEYTSTSTSFTVYPTQSFFPNIMALAADLNKTVNAYCTANFSQTVNIILVELTDGNFRFAVYNPTLSHLFVLTTNYDPLGLTTVDTNAINNKVGFVGGFEHVYVRTGSNPFEDTWLPNYYSADTWYFVDDASENFKGVTGVDGNLSGSSFTPRSMRDFEWKFQINTNAIKGCTTSTEFESNNSFENIINSARANSLQISTDNTYCKGVYFVDDLSSFAAYYDSGLQNTLPLSYNSGSLTGDYIFCSAGPPRIPGSSFDNTKNWYDCNVKLTTAVAPTWTWDIS